MSVAVEYVHWTDPIAVTGSAYPRASGCTSWRCRCKPLSDFWGSCRAEMLRGLSDEAVLAEQVLRSPLLDTLMHLRGPGVGVHSVGWQLGAEARLAACLDAGDAAGGLRASWV